MKQGADYISNGSNIPNLVAQNQCQPSPADWEEIREAVYHHYVTRKRPLKVVREILARDRNFRATDRMYKARLKEWAFNKNARGSDWDALAILHQRRKEDGKTATEFFIHGKRKTVADLHAHVRSRNKTDEEFLASAVARGCAIPSHVRCHTPDLNGTGKSSSQSPPQDALIPSPALTPDGQQLTQIESASSSFIPNRLLTYRASTDLDPADLPPIRTSFSDGLYNQPTRREGMDSADDFVLVSDTSRTPSEFSSTSSSSCDQILQDVRTMALQVFKPANLMSRVCGAEDISSWVLVSSTAGKNKDGQYKEPDSGPLCPKCIQPISKHAISLEGLAPSTKEPRNLLDHSDRPAMTLPASTDGHGEAWRWIAFCFLACMTLSRGEDNRSAEFLKSAAAEFEEMLAKHDCLILIGLNLMLSILHMHDQGSIAEAVVRSAFDVVERVRPADDPIRLTIRWMTAVAARKLEESGRNEEALKYLKHIYETMLEDLGATNPSTLAALYNYAWMLCFEGRLQEAEEKLLQLYAASSSSLSPTHMQSITALTTLSRAQSDQGNYNAGIETIQKAIRDSRTTLGDSHPHRLESKRRLALMYEAIGEVALMEDLYWEVLKGRIKMLGPQHPWTEGMRMELVDLLKKLGKWNEDGTTEWSIDVLYARPSPASDQHRAF